MLTEMLREKLLVDLPGRWTPALKAIQSGLLGLALRALRIFIR
jgi:hypothetical protein